MIRKIYRFIIFRIIKILSKLNLTFLKYFISQLIRQKIQSLTPDEALKFVFTLENDLYKIEGEKAIEYDNGIHTKHRHIKYHDFFCSRINKKNKVLDVGCGNGAVSFDIANKTGAEVTAIDINAEYISIAQSRYSHPRVKYIIGDAMKYIPSGAYNYIVLSNVLEHLSNRVSFLQQLIKQTHASKLLIRVPLFERDWRVPLKRELDIEWRLDPTHEIEYTLESFGDEMEKADLYIYHQEVRWGEIWADVRPVESK